MLSHRTVTNVNELQSIASRWEGVREECKGPAYLSFDWADLWFKSFSKSASPHVILVEEGKKIQGILPLVQTVTAVMGVRLKRLSFFGDCPGTAESYDNEVLCAGNHDEVLDQIIAALKGSDWNLLQLCDLRDTPFSSALCKRVDEEWQTDGMPRIPCPYVELPSSGDVLGIIGSRTRRQIRSVSKALQTEDRIAFQIEDSPEGVEQAMRTYVVLHRERWMKKGGSILTDETLSTFLIDVSRILAEKGIGRVYEVRIDGKVASQLLCIDDWDCIRAYRIGMSESAKEYSPGNMVVCFAMGDAQKRGFRRFDFGKGAEEFKYRMGAKDAFLIGVEAKKGSLQVLSKMASLPGVKRVVDKTRVKDAALKKMYE